MKTALDFYNNTPHDAFLAVIALRRWLEYGVVDREPDAISIREETHLWSCHAVCRAALKVEPHLLAGWRVVDGYFGSVGHEHSWLEWNPHPLNDRTEAHVMDVYPVASHGGPLLINIGNYCSPWASLYIESPRNFLYRVKDFYAEAEELLRLSKTK